MIYKRSYINGKPGAFRIGIGRHYNLTNLCPFPNLVVPGAIEPHIHFKRLRGMRLQPQVKGGFITRLSSFKGLQSFGILSQTTKTKVFVADDVTIFNGANRHMVVPNVPGVLLNADVGKIGSIPGRIILIGIQTVDMKAFRSHLSTGISPTLVIDNFPYFIISIRVVSSDGNGTPF